ncbi:inhibitor of growth protein 3 isoform X2 [Engraulis encrasicolus]|uniref:inhibitor of growth protein 3 isoform X2 n=1 Tax=Engraulis encrasicolus TaxID=184585 RepID=UPI002FD3F266
MLYLEDYLEMIEQLPMDLRDRFTEMREMDLQVQNAMDQLEQRVNDFFINAKKNKPEWREEQMEVIKKDYYKALEDADEKVTLANQIYDLVDRHLRKLDQELAKFKMELEADNAGITEILERRSLEMDSPSQPVNNHHVHSHTTVEKRKYTTQQSHHTTEHVPEKKFKSEALLSTLTSDASKENTPGIRANSVSSSSNSVYSVNSSQPLGSYNLTSLPAGPGTGAGAITMAAAQAVQATAQMKEGRRTSSLKASYEAIKNNDFQLGRDFTTVGSSSSSGGGGRGGGGGGGGGEGGGYSSSALASTLTQNMGGQPANSSSGASSTSEARGSGRKTNNLSESRGSGRKTKGNNKSSSHHQSSSSSSSSSLSSCSSSSALAHELVQQSAALPEADANSQVDWTYDPNEPRYCICNQVSYGEMVGCDNPDCPIEWFHYGCVGLTEAPKGKWYCPQCNAAIKRRGSRHK